MNLTQHEVSERSGVSQGWISELELGKADAGWFENWAAVAAATGKRFTAYLEDAPGADRPRDHEHLKRQSLVLAIAASGGWEGSPEVAVDRTMVRSPSVDVLLSRPRRREVTVVEIWDYFDDVGAAMRSIDAKIAAVARGLATTRVAERWHVGGLWVVRGTRRNRALVAEFGAVFAAKFPGSSRAWLDALQDRDRPMPARTGFLWTDVVGTRLLEARLSRRRYHGDL
jgi:transcriptional regulator with XRE-family HTH domain